MLFCSIRPRIYTERAVTSQQQEEMERSRKRTVKDGAARTRENAYLSGSGALKLRMSPRATAHCYTPIRYPTGNGIS